MDIKDIILKSIFGQLNDIEQQQLNEWQKQEEHAHLYERVRTSINEKNAVEYLASIDVEKALKKVKGETADDKQEQFGRWQLHIAPRHVFQVAAVLILIIVGGTFWYRDYTRVTPPSITNEVMAAMKKSEKTGTQKAEVVTGKTVTDVISPQDLTRYHVDEDFVEQLNTAKRITTYHDKEYWVTLDDGTLVHLNYDSKLIYPERFGDRRDVILEGEAYFMVAKDKSRRFVVHTPQGDIKVYGTEFMVNTRSHRNNDFNSNATSVVLVKGSIGVTPTVGQEQMLHPGQELTVDNGKVIVSQVNTEPFVAWHEGKFIFDEWPLERIMQVMSMWYGRQVEFSDNEIKQQLYSGYFDRYEDIYPTMEAIEAITGLKITLKKDKIIIEP